MNLRILLAEASASGSDSEETLFLRDVLTELEGREFWSDWVHLETQYASGWEQTEAILQPSATAQAAVDLLLLDLNLHEPARETMRGPLPSPRGPTRRAMQGTEIFRRVKAAAPQVPVVLLVDPQDITLAEFLLREGAQDFLVKSQVDCAPLAHAIRNAIERHRYLDSARAAAMTDPLTGLLNRSTFLALVERDRKLALGSQRRMLLAVGETATLDDSEEAQPHAQPTPRDQDAGNHSDDLSLVRIAEQLRAASGPTDLVARIGERRFGIAVCETEAPGWGAAWTRLQAASAAAHLMLGAVEFDPARPATLEDLLRQAERELAPVAVAARR